MRITYRVKTVPVDEFTTCRECGYRIRPGWRTNKHAEVCGRCARELGEPADYVAVNEHGTTSDPWRGSEYDY
jgi:hypothetical protein